MKALVKDAEKQSEILVNNFTEYEAYRLGHLKNYMPTLYPSEWLTFCAESFDKERCKAFINSDETQAIGPAAGYASAYMTSLKDFAESKAFLAAWWGKACGEDGAHALAHGAVKQARMVLIGAKAQKIADKPAKRKAVNKIKESITTNGVQDIFPAALSNLLNAV